MVLLNCVFLYVEKTDDEFDDTYMGYDRWSPSPPKLEKPRSVFNAASLAFIGDSFYEVCLPLHSDLYASCF